MTFIETEYMNIWSLISLLPQTVYWTPQSSAVMIACNALSIIFLKDTIQVKGVGSAVPLGSAFLGMTLVELIATTSMGHIIGAGVILGLRSNGFSI